MYSRPLVMQSQPVNGFWYKSQIKHEKMLFHALSKQLHTGSPFYIRPPLHAVVSAYCSNVFTQLRGHRTAFRHVLTIVASACSHSLNRNPSMRWWNSITDYRLRAAAYREPSFEMRWQVVHIPHGYVISTTVTPRKGWARSYFLKTIWICTEVSAAVSSTTFRDTLSVLSFHYLTFTLQSICKIRVN
jgi:hypothetical protein